MESDFVFQLRKEGPPPVPLKCDYFTRKWWIFQYPKKRGVGEKRCLHVQESLRRKPTRIKRSRREDSGIGDFLDYQLHLGGTSSSTNAVPSFQIPINKSRREEELA